MIRHIFYYTIALILSGVVWRLSLSWLVEAQSPPDLLETAYDQSKTFDYVADLGTSRSSVGQWVFKKWYTLYINKWIKFTTQDSLFVRIIKWFLQIIVILGVPLLIFGGIKYMVAAGDEWAQKSARTFMINVIIGIILALASLAIISFAASLLNDTWLMWVPRK